MFIHRLSGPDLQVSTCSKLYFVLVFKCLYTDYQDHTYKLVHVVNYTLFWYLNVTQTIHRLSGLSPDLQVSTCSKLYFVLVFKCLYTDYQDQTYKLVHVVNYTLFWYLNVYTQTIRTRPTS